MTSLSSLSSQKLAERIRKLIRIESGVVVEMVFCFAELQRRREHLAAGYDSLYTYCREALGLNRSKAWRRSSAAELIVDFPLAAELVGSRRLSVSALVALKKPLTRENHVDILNQAIGMTEDQAVAFAARLTPIPRRADSIRVVYAVRDAPPPHSPNAASPPASSAAGSSAALPELVIEESVQVGATVSKKVYEQLLAVKSALSHQIPDGNLNDVLAECFRITLAVCERRKIGAPARILEPTVEIETAAVPHSAASASVERSASVLGPRMKDDSIESAPSCGLGEDEFNAFERQLDDASRWVATAVKRAVWIRDGGRCSFVGEGGRHCGSTHQLEFDHWRAFSLGGKHTSIQPSGPRDRIPAILSTQPANATQVRRTRHTSDHVSPRPNSRSTP